MKWWEHPREQDRIKARVPLKDGPYRLMHWSECCCERCCGPILAKEIKEFYDTCPGGEKDIMSRF